MTCVQSENNIINTLIQSPYKLFICFKKMCHGEKKSHIASQGTVRHVALIT